DLGGEDRGSRIEDRGRAPVGARSAEVLGRYRWAGANAANAAMLQMLHAPLGKQHFPNRGSASILDPRSSILDPSRAEEKVAAVFPERYTRTLVPSHCVRGLCRCTRPCSRPS